jgi:hypothetical protein
MDSGAESVHIGAIVRNVELLDFLHDVVGLGTVRALEAAQEIKPSVQISKYKSYYFQM